MNPRRPAPARCFHGLTECSFCFGVDGHRLGDVVDRRPRCGACGRFVARATPDVCRPCVARGVIAAPRLFKGRRRTHT